MMATADNTALTAPRDDAPVDAGAERLSPRQRAMAAAPLMMLLVAGAPLLYTHHLVITALLLWAALAARGGVVAVAKEERAITPSESVRLGVGAFSAAMLANAVHWYFRRPFGHAPIFWVLWPVFTALAVRRASKTDMQSGWAAGASSMAAFGLIRALGAISYGGHLAWLLWLMAAASGVAGFHLWRFLGSQGRGRSLAALSSVTAGLVAGLGASVYCALGQHLLLGAAILFVPLYSLIEPVLKNRGALRNQLDSASKEALPPAEI